jgi:hypothetical protein
MTRYHFEAFDPATGQTRRLRGHTTDPVAAEPFRAAEEAALRCQVRLVPDRDRQLGDLVCTFAAHDGGGE